MFAVSEPSRQDRLQVVRRDEDGRRRRTQTPTHGSRQEPCDREREEAVAEADGLRSVVGQDRGDAPGSTVEEGAQAGEVGIGPASCGLDLDGHGASSLLHHEINFVTSLFVPEAQPGIGMMGFQDGGQVLDDVALVQRPAHAVVATRLDGINAGHAGGEPAVREVELGRFDESGATVPQERREPSDEEGRFQKVEVTAGSDGGQTRIPGDAGDGEDLPGPKGRQLGEGLEGDQVRDLGKLADIAFHVGLDVGPEPIGGMDSGIETDGWQSSRQDLDVADGFGVLERHVRIAQELDDEGRGLGFAPDLASGQWMEGEVAGATGEGLRDGGHEREVGRAGEDEASLRPVLIHSPLDGDEQFGATLDLIEDDRLGEEGFRVGSGAGEGSEVIEGPVSVITGDAGFVLDERGLAGLAESGEDDNGEGFEGPEEPGCDFPVPVLCHNATLDNGIMTVRPKWFCCTHEGRRISALPRHEHRNGVATSASPWERASDGNGTLPPRMGRRLYRAAPLLRLQHQRASDAGDDRPAGAKYGVGPDPPGLRLLDCEASAREQSLLQLEVGG